MIEITPRFQAFYGNIFLRKFAKLSDPRLFTKKLIFDMLSENDRHAFQAFQSEVMALEQMLLSECDRTTLKPQIVSLQTVFQNQIQLIQSEDYRVRSILVEVDKQMRLLNVDAMFLQTARQAETAQQRVNQLCDRLQLLKNYCDALLGSEPD